MISQEVGMPFTLSSLIQVGLPVMSFAGASQLATEFPFEEEVGNSLVVREPVGVVGAITPWNYPLHQTAAKVAPALAAGCTVVLKPSAVAPLNAFVLAEIIQAAGLPAGRVQSRYRLRPGGGRSDREAPRCRHGVLHRLDARRHTCVGTRRGHGEARRTRIGRQVRCGHSRRRRPRSRRQRHDQLLLPELRTDLLGAHAHAGAESKYEEAANIAVEVAKGFTVGDPFGGAAKLGPLISSEQRDSVRGYIKKGIEEGAELLIGGAESPEGLDKGYFVRPTVFSNVTRPHHRPGGDLRARAVHHPLRHEDEAVEIANDTVYGLAGGVWAGDKEHAERVARGCAPAKSRSTVGRSTRWPLRWLQAVRQRPRAGEVRPRGVPGGQGAPALIPRRGVDSTLCRDCGPGRGGPRPS